MKKLLSIGLPVLALTALVANFAIGPVEGQVKKGKKRPLQTKTLMAHVVKTHCGGIGAALKADEVDFDAITAKAELLNECGHILMADGRCPDGDWAKAAKTLQECSAVVIKKAADEDKEGVQGAFQAMTKACGACHSKHKK